MRMFKIRQAARVIRAGGVIAYPTEAVFGLGCDPAFAEAVQHICEIKARPMTAGLILIGHALEQFEGWIDIGAAEQKRLQEPADRPLTWVVPAGRRTGAWITGGRSSVAVRITSHLLAAELCRAAGTPLVSTSANRHGRPPARTTLVARLLFRDAVDLVVPGKVGRFTKPSEIRDARTGAVLRAG
jgi:L-threonylcarbamoyladenylate synthase